jgi:hypothetical protein
MATNPQSRQKTNVPGSTRKEFSLQSLMHQPAGQTNKRFLPATQFTDEPARQTTLPLINKAASKPQTNALATNPLKEGNNDHFHQSARK